MLFEHISLYNKSLGSDTQWWGFLYRLLQEDLFAAPGSLCDESGRFSNLNEHTAWDSGADLSTFIFFTFRKYILRRVNPPDLSHFIFLLHFWKRRYQVIKDARNWSCCTINYESRCGCVIVHGTWILRLLVQSFQPGWGLVDLHRECIQCKTFYFSIASGHQGPGMDLTPH